MNSVIIKESMWIKVSIGRLDKKFQELNPELEVYEDGLKLMNLSILFSMVFKKNHTPDIYDGEEIISFDNRDIKFKEILMNEFLIH